MLVKDMKQGDIGIIDYLGSNVVVIRGITNFVNHFSSDPDSAMWPALTMLAPRHRAGSFWTNESFNRDGGVNSKEVILLNLRLDPDFGITDDVS